MKKEYKRLISLALAVAAVGMAPALLASCSGPTDDKTNGSDAPASTHDTATPAPGTSDASPDTTAHMPESTAADTSGTTTAAPETTAASPETATTAPATTPAAPGTTAAAPVTEPVTPPAETTANEEAPLTLRIGSYNIQHGALASGDLTLIGDVIKNARLDICGIQEVDLGTARVNGADQPALLAAAAGMEYYRFTRSIDYHGGEYGTLILSHYPIEEFTATKLYSGEKEGRAVGHTVINVNGRRIDFFNTHLSYESRELRRVQFGELRGMLDDCGTYILTADFNTEDFGEFDALGYGALVNNRANRLVTFPGASTAIDNIVVSADIKPGACGTVRESHSDHYMLWSELTVAAHGGN